MKYFIQTFGCQANEADSERIASYYRSRGYTKSRTMKHADDIVINTCMIKEKAENRVYGLVHNLTQEKALGRNLKIVITGCMVGMAMREKSGRMLSALKRKMPQVDEFLPIEEVGFDHAPLRSDTNHAWVPISNGCNNFCTFCVVPFTRGRELSRPFDDVVNEVKELAEKGYKRITLIGQNVNSYGADLLVGAENIQVMRDLPGKQYFETSSSHHSEDLTSLYSHLLPRHSPNQSRHSRHLPRHSLLLPRHSRESGNLYGVNTERPKNSDVNSDVNSDDDIKKEYLLNGKKVKPTFVKHLGRLRIPTIFPYLLKTLCTIEGIEHIDFLSSNPWDFSDDLIETIAQNPKITRHIHLPVQSGDSALLKKMNRWYTTEEYLTVVNKLKNKIKNVTISTDIIVGFCGETDEQFENTVKLCKEVGFSKVYVSIYSDRLMTTAHKVYSDDVPHTVKKKRWMIIEEMVNRTNLKAGTYR